MSEKINELIIHVKEYLHLEEKESEQTLREIENQIDDKNIEIRNIFAQNFDAVISHFIKYQEIISYQRKVEHNSQEFSRKIQKSMSINTYDEQAIERNEKALIELKSKRKQIQTLRESIRCLKKAAISIQDERYSNAIKLLNAYRQKQPTIDTPLKKTMRIFNEQIKGHLINLISGFWETNRVKILDIGTHCYNKVELSTHEKTNIYQAFFGRNSTTRNSLIRKSSIIDDGKGEAPLRFLKKIKDEDILQKFILRINVEMNSLKQTKMLCKEMKEEELFQDMLNKEIRKFIADIAKQTPCQNDTDFKKLLSTYIGLLLFRREVIAYFSIEGQNKTVFAQVYSLIGQQAKALLSKPINTSQILNIKSMLDIFHKVLEIVDLDSKSAQYTLVLADIFKIYCSFSLEQYQAIIGEQISEDNLMSFKPDNDEDPKMIEEILHIKPPLKNQSYNFTSFVVYMMQIFNQFYDRMVAFVKDSELNKSQLHDYLSALMERIVAVYGGLLVGKDQPLQIAQGELNLHYCETIFIYFSNQLEIKHEYMRKNEFSYKAKLEGVIVDLRRRMIEIVEVKIKMMMSSYEQENVWLPVTVNTEPNDFIQWLLEFIKQVIYQMRRSKYPAHEEMAYLWIGYIVQVYWEYLEQCRQYNLLTIYNLDLDLLFIYKFLSRYFPYYPDISDKLKSLTQFYAFLLTNNIQDILDKQKRDISYSHLDVMRMIFILKKYNKAKHTANGKIRDLKKKDIENITKKLETQYK